MTLGRDLDSVTKTDTGPRHAGNNSLADDTGPKTSACVEPSDISFVAEMISTPSSRPQALLGRWSIGFLLELWFVAIMPSLIEPTRDKNRLAKRSKTATTAATTEPPSGLMPLSYEFGSGERIAVSSLCSFTTCLELPQPNPLRRTMWLLCKSSDSSSKMQKTPDCTQTGILPPRQLHPS